MCSPVLAFTEGGVASSRGSTACSDGRIVAAAGIVVSLCPLGQFADMIVAASREVPVTGGLGWARQPNSVVKNFLCLTAVCCALFAARQSWAGTRWMPQRLRRHHGKDGRGRSARFFPD